MIIFSSDKTKHLTPLSGLVYRKAISLRDLSGLTVGELLNICTNDAQRVFGACHALAPISI